MLVLSRYKDEAIMLGDDIELTIVEIRSDGKVRIGITAPASVPVHRKEIWMAIQIKEDDACREEEIQQERDYDYKQSRPLG